MVQPPFPPGYLPHPPPAGTEACLVTVEVGVSPAGAASQQLGGSGAGASLEGVIIFVVPRAILSSQKLWQGAAKAVVTTIPWLRGSLRDLTVRPLLI